MTTLSKLSIKFLTISTLLFAASCSQETVEKKEKELIPVPVEILFEDTMTSDWQKNWFLDGKNATLEHRDEGLFFSAGTITKTMDSEAYHAHHAVLWTKEVFEGDIRISYDVTRIDSSDYGNTLLYIQAQGIGGKLYDEDITKWKDQRQIPAMSEYYEKMDLISLSFRGNLRCKRYPWKDSQGEWYPQRGLIAPMIDYRPLTTEKTYQVEVVKLAETCKLILKDKDSGELIADYTWDLKKVPAGIEPHFVTKGRIGIRHMSTKQMIYRNFKIERLEMRPEMRAKGYGEN